MENTKRNITTIELRVETKKCLDEIGRKPESYNDIVERLIKFCKEHQGCTALIEGGD